MATLKTQVVSVDQFTKCTPIPLRHMAYWLLHNSDRLRDRNFHNKLACEFRPPIDATVSDNCLQQISCRWTLTPPLSRSKCFDRASAFLEKAARVSWSLPDIPSNRLLHTCPHHFGTDNVDETPRSSVESIEDMIKIDFTCGLVAVIIELHFDENNILDEVKAVGDSRENGLLPHEQRRSLRMLVRKLPCLLDITLKGCFMQLIYVPKPIEGPVHIRDTSKSEPGDAERVELKSYTHLFDAPCTSLGPVEELVISARKTSIAGRLPLFNLKQNCCITPQRFVIKSKDKKKLKNSLRLIVRPGKIATQRYTYKWRTIWF